MEDLNRLKQLSGIRAKDKNIQQLNELNEAPKRQASPAPGPSQGYDDSPLGALRQYDAAKAAGTLPPVTRAPSAPSPSPSGGSAPVKIVPTKGGDYPVYSKASPEAGSFRDAFAAARAEQGAGGTFTWQGRSYSTNRADDKPATPAVRPITSPGTSSVPKAGAGMPAQPSAIGPSTGPTSRFGDPTSAPYGQLPTQPMNRTGVAPAPSTPALPVQSPDGPAPRMTTPPVQSPDGPAPKMTTPLPPASGGGQFKDTVGRMTDPKGVTQDTVGRPTDPKGTYSRASSATDPEAVVPPTVTKSLSVPPAGAGMPAQGYARPAAAPGDMTFKSDLLSKQAKGDFSEEELEETFRTAYEAAMAEVDNSPIKYDPNKRDTSPISTGSGDNRPIPYNPSAGGSTPPGTVPYRAPPPPPATAMTGEKDTNPFSKPALEGDLTSIFGGGIKPLSRDEIIRQSGQYPGSPSDVTSVPPGAYTNDKGQSFQDRVNAAADNTPIDLKNPKDNRPYTLAPPPDSIKSNDPKIAAPSAAPVSGSTGPAVGTDSDGNRIIPYRPVPKDTIIQYEPSNNPFATQIEKDAYWASKALQKGQKPLPHEQSALDQINAHKKANKYESADKPDYIDADNDGDKEEAMKKALKDKQRSDEALERLKMAAGIW